MKLQRGDWALVTGASSGIGAEFARVLAERGVNVALAARSTAKLEALAQELQRKEVQTRVLTVDLTAPGAVAVLVRELAAAKVEIDLLVSNAGFGTFGRFDELDRGPELAQVQLNVTALVELTHALLPPMMAKKRGGIIHVSSNVAFQPVPYMAVYGATKAFVLSFSEALWAEHRSTGVDILAVCPGATDTAFFEHTGDSMTLTKKASPRAVVESGLRALAKRKSYVVYGARNYLIAQSSRFSPRALAARIAEKLMHPREGRALPAGSLR